MKVNLLVLLLPVFLTGCGASLVSVRDIGNPHGPVNEVKGGTVQYLNDGYSTVKEGRRNDAYEKMFTYCDGPYRIVREYVTSEGSVGSNVSNQFNYALNSSDMNIDFECANGKIN